MNQHNHIRVLLVDDHEMVRNGLAVFLEGFANLKLVGEAANGAEAIRLCEETQPDIVLMDLKMPGMDGVAATRAIRGAFPQVRIIVLSSFRDEELLEDALKAGAAGYLLKNTSVEELAHLINRAVADSAA